MEEGHCALPVDQILALTVELLEVPRELAETALALELTDRSVVADTVGEVPCVFLAGLHRAERIIAERLLQLADGTLS